MIDHDRCGWLLDRYEQLLREHKALQELLAVQGDELIKAQRLIMRINASDCEQMTEYEEELAAYSKGGKMSHTDQLSELIRLWNSLNNGQRESVLRLLQAITEEEENGCNTEVQVGDSGD